MRPLYGCAIAGAELASLADYIETLDHNPGALAKLRQTAATASYLAAPLRLFGEPPTQQDVSWSRSFDDGLDGELPEDEAWLWIDQIKRLDTMARFINCRLPR